MLEKTFTPAEMEARLYAEWENRGFFKPGRKPQGRCLHHRDPAAQCDGLAAHGACPQQHHPGHPRPLRADARQGRAVAAGHRPCGHRHADGGGAPARRKENNTDRRTMGREAFLKRVWEWKAESGGIISQQLRRLGASCDWSRERFTMDEGLSKAVLKVFVQLYKEGLIYKDKRLVNWDPKLLTAISDLEVVQKEQKGNLWYLRYPIVGSG
jgi:valyl-tRNA synthetase